jgi:hypothetical protein
MKKLFVALMLVFFVSSFSVAQINKNWDGTKPEVHQGAKCFQFMYSPFVDNLSGVKAGYYSQYSTTLGELQAMPLAGVGFQYYITSNIGLAIGFNFGSASQTGVDSTDVDHARTLFGVSLDGNYHFKSLYGVSPYFGLNVNMGSYKETSTTKTATSVETKWTGGAIGGGLNFGFDWYFTPGLSIGGKYTLGILSLTAPEKTVGAQAPVKLPSASSFGTGVGTFMLNVHF